MKTSATTEKLQFRSQQVFKTHTKLTETALEIARSIQLAQFSGYAPKVYTGRLLSGDQFINQREKAEELWKSLHGICADMEAAAIAHTCSLNKTPFLCIRAISDKADQSATVSFTDFLVVATANYGKIFNLILKQLDTVPV